MAYQGLKNYLPQWDIRQQQTNNIVLITFWSQFSSYALNTILILFLTRPLLTHGLGYNQETAYAFMGVSQATGYLMPVLGGFMADKILGIRRAILLGSVMLASAYLLVMLSGYTLTSYGDTLFIAAYALIPATNSLLMGTASSMVSHIYADDAIKAKSAMTFYYMAINIGGLLATFIAPALLDSRYGPLSVLALTFAGKAIAALNFAKRYSLYDQVAWGKDRLAFSRKSKYQLAIYILSIYCFTLFAYSYVYLASLIVGLGCALGIFWFLKKTLSLSGTHRTKQLVALLLIVEAIVFFIIYNQMNSTLVLFAKNNSDLQLCGLSISAAQYQLLNPLLIIAIGTQLPRFYRLFPRFTIPYQFAAGTLLASCALILLAFAANRASNGYINGNYIGLSYIFITLAELWVSAIGLSMIGLYCDSENIAFAMGVWYLAASMSNAISGRLAGLVAIPDNLNSALQSLKIYQHYYLLLGGCTLVLGLMMLILAYVVQYRLRKKGIVLV
ncbi:Dipeptide and tripeptide permease A [Legionella massiliensis]|uniref:Dipeptide and tripeptide permease A n=1 Tax=Legionella massiliensis TaxID=1034943 RepID=A0A078L0M6_9GAMM|nr:oligopeptide:H+ symporter [Legionella massiliensis]CDZ78802.1 Dipeptide and tripeptide permease A [Legionella massiliensis]CEE14540.1 Dipeptide and tripeptide permease A [Legionella massiliensis]